MWLDHPPPACVSGVIVRGFGLWVLGLGPWVLGFGSWVLGSGFWVPCLGLGFWFGVLGVGFGVKLWCIRGVAVAVEFGLSCGSVGLWEGYSLAGGVGLRFRVSDFGYRTYLSAFLYCVYFVFISGIVGIDFGCISVEVHAGSDRATGSLASLFGTLLSAFHFQPRPYFCYLGMSLPLGAQPSMAMISGIFRVRFGHFG